MHSSLAAINLLTIFIHISIKASVESACSALVAVSLIDGAVPFAISLSFAGVHPSTMYAAFEKPRATYNCTADIEDTT